MKEQLQATPPPTASTTAPTVTTTTPTATPTATTSLTVEPVVTGGARPFGVAPWVVTGAGGAILIVGAILTPVGISKYNKADKACPSHIGCPTDVTDEGSSGRTLQGVGIAALGVGAAAIAGGLIWQFAFNKPAEQPRTGLTVAPALSKEMRGVTLMGAF